MKRKIIRDRINIESIDGLSIDEAIHHLEMVKEQLSELNASQITLTEWADYGSQWTVDFDRLETDKELEARKKVNKQIRDKKKELIENEKKKTIELAKKHFGIDLA